MRRKFSLVRREIFPQQNVRESNHTMSFGTNADGGPRLCVPDHDRETRSRLPGDQGFAGGFCVLKYAHQGVNVNGLKFVPSL